MKRIIILGIAILASMVSCSTEETQESNVQTTDVKFLVAAPANTTGKQVDKGAIPAWVNKIEIQAVSGSYTKSEQYDLVVNNPNADKNFILADVAIGSNVFTAVSSTDSAKKYVLAPSSGTAEAKITELKAHNPYVLYTGTKTQTVVATNNVINIDMTTKHGRIISVFQLENNSTFKNGFEATITATVDGEASAGTTKVQKDGIVYFEWSNDKALEGKKVVYKVDVTPINNNNNLHTIYYCEQIIKASTSISCIYTISKENAPSPYTSENKLVFSFQKWNEEECQSCKN